MYANHSMAHLHVAITCCHHKLINQVMLLQYHASLQRVSESLNQPVQSFWFLHRSCIDACIEQMICHSKASMNCCRISSSQPDCSCPRQKAYISHIYSGSGHKTACCFQVCAAWAGTGWLACAAWRPPRSLPCSAEPAPRTPDERSADPARAISAVPTSLAAPLTAAYTPACTVAPPKCRDAHTLAPGSWSGTPAGMAAAACTDTCSSAPGFRLPPDPQHTGSCSACFFQPSPLVERPLCVSQRCCSCCCRQQCGPGCSLYKGSNRHRCRRFCQSCWIICQPCWIIR